MLDVQGIIKNIRRIEPMSQSPILDEISTVCAIPMTLGESSLSGEVIVLPILEVQRPQ